MSNTTTKFKIAPVVGDWVLFNGKPRQLTNNMQFRDLSDYMTPAPLTPTVMGWIGETRDAEFSGIIITVDEETEIIYDPRGNRGEGLLGIRQCGMRVEVPCGPLHELQQLYRLLSGGKELTIKPTI